MERENWRHDNNTFGYSDSSSSDGNEPTNATANHAEGLHSATKRLSSERWLGEVDESDWDSENADHENKMVNRTIRNSPPSFSDAYSRAFKPLDNSRMTLENKQINNSDEVESPENSWVERESRAKSSHKPRGRITTTLIQTGARNNVEKKRNACDSTESATNKDGTRQIEARHGDLRITPISKRQNTRSSSASSSEGHNITQQQIRQQSEAALVSKIKNVLPRGTKDQRRESEFTECGKTNADTNKNRNATRSDGNKLMSTEKLAMLEEGKGDEFRLSKPGSCQSNSSKNSDDKKSNCGEVTSDDATDSSSYMRRVLLMGRRREAELANQLKGVLNRNVNLGKQVAELEKQVEEATGRMEQEITETKAVKANVLIAHEKRIKILQNDYDRRLSELQKTWSERADNCDRCTETKHRFSEHVEKLRQIFGTSCETKTDEKDIVLGQQSMSTLFEEFRKECRQIESQMENNRKELNSKAEELEKVKEENVCLTRKLSVAKEEEKQLLSQNEEQKVKMKKLTKQLEEVRKYAASLENGVQKKVAQAKTGQQKTEQLERRLLKAQQAEKAQRLMTRELTQQIAFQEKRLQQAERTEYELRSAVEAVEENEKELKRLAAALQEEVKLVNQERVTAQNRARVLSAASDASEAEREAGKSVRQKEFDRSIRGVFESTKMLRVPTSRFASTPCGSPSSENVSDTCMGDMTDDKHVDRRQQSPYDVNIHRYNKNDNYTYDNFGGDNGIDNNSTDNMLQHIPRNKTSVDNFTTFGEVDHSPISTISTRMKKTIASLLQDIKSEGQNFTLPENTFPQGAPPTATLTDKKRNGTEHVLLNRLAAGLTIPPKPQKSAALRISSNNRPPLPKPVSSISTQSLHTATTTSPITTNFTVIGTTITDKGDSTKKRIFNKNIDSKLGAFTDSSSQRINDQHNDFDANWPPPVANTRGALRNNSDEYDSLAINTTNREIVQREKLEVSSDLANRNLAQHKNNWQNAYSLNLPLKTKLCDKEDNYKTSGSSSGCNYSKSYLSRDEVVDTRSNDNISFRGNDTKYVESPRETEFTFRNPHWPHHNKENINGDVNIVPSIIQQFNNKHHPDTSTIARRQSADHKTNTNDENSRQNINESKSSTRRNNKRIYNSEAPAQTQSLYKGGRRLLIGHSSVILSPSSQHSSRLSFSPERHSVT